jgi:XTP/dITP diphosphohydrolase
VRIVIATNNRKKFEEIAAVLEDSGIQAVPLAEAGFVGDLPEETADSFEGNARLKAEAVCSVLDEAALADDSGLMVDALGGKPGVLSARYAGVGAGDAANNRKLLEELKSVPESKRTAKFVCVIAVARPGLPRKETQVFTGEVKGRILFEPRGKGGFGYDPLFYCPELGKTFAEAPAWKARVSHRVRALEKAVEFLKKEGGRER